MAYTESFSDYEAVDFAKEQEVLKYILLKGCAWAVDISRGITMDIHTVNSSLSRLMKKKDIILVEPFERFTPPDIVMTRAKTLYAENCSSTTPEHWAKRSFFYATDEGLQKFAMREKGGHLRAHVIYLIIYNLIKKEVEN